MNILIITVLAATSPHVPNVTQACRQLEDLNRQYIGTTLTAEEQQIKRELLAWYRANCSTKRK